MIVTVAGPHVSPELPDPEPEPDSEPEPEPDSGEFPTPPKPVDAGDPNSDLVIGMGTMLIVD